MKPINIGISIDICVRHPLDNDAISDCTYYSIYRSIKMDNQRNLEKLIKDCDTIINRYKISNMRDNNEKHLS